ncbi:MAG: hypothetical protein ACRYFS_20230 [Janthinobacterium lividum]
MKKLDKKQIPQFIALCVVTAGLAGYVVMHLVAPGPVAAGTRTAAVPAAADPSAAAKPAGAKPGDTQPDAAKPGDATASVTGAGDAPPPTPAMHDPFAVGYIDPATVPAATAAPSAPALPKLPAALKQTADIHGIGAMPVSFPGAPALPAGLSGFPSHPGTSAPSLPSGPAAPALPMAPTTPLWTVTGVLQGASGKVAILRSGEARRIVRSGDFVDSTYRVTGVTRTAVTLRHGATYYQLVLGGTKSAPAKPGTVPAIPAAMPSPTPMPTSSPVSAPVSLPQIPAIFGSAIIPVYHLPQPKSPLVPSQRQETGLKLTSDSLVLPRLAGKRKVPTAKVANGILLGLRLLDGSVLAEDRKPQDHKSQ